MRRKKKLLLHQKIKHHLRRHFHRHIRTLRKHFHRHIHKALHISNHLHHNFSHSLELIVVTMVTITSFGFANLTGLNQDLYRTNDSDVAQHLVTAMQNPATSLKQGNLISIRTMDMDVENTFAKGYCTYGAARVSPEFFPFTDKNTQQRTWGGNAVDRCKNASDTGYKIGSTPVQGALIVYDAGGRFGAYGHVGKVLHYDKTLKKIIVRDMARVARGSMSDRREDLTTANVKCYIYNSKTTIPDTATPDSTIPPVVSITGINIPTTGTTVTVPTDNHPSSNNTPTTPTTTTPVITQPTPPVVVTPPKTPTPVPTQPVVTTPIVSQPETPVVVTPPTTPVITPSPTSVNKKIELSFDKLSDIAEHFITQDDITLTLVSTSPLKLGETATLTLKIQDKRSGEPYVGLLPFSFTILSTNDSLQPSMSNIQMIHNGSVDISILAQKSGTASIVIFMDDKKIGEFSLTAE